MTIVLTFSFSSCGLNNQACLRSVLSSDHLCFYLRCHCVPIETMLKAVKISCNKSCNKTKLSLKDNVMSQGCLPVNY